MREKVELLLVQNSKGVAIDKSKGTLTLKGVGATTLFFSDRPVRMAGHYNKEDYLKLWADGKDSFDADPPNATLSVFEEGQDDLLDVVVKLQNPRYQGEDLIYDITLIEGKLPKKGGPSSLFIDIFGIWRRTARRAVWVSAAAATSAEAAASAHPTTVTVPETAPPPAAPAMSSSQASPSPVSKSSSRCSSRGSSRRLNTRPSPRSCLIGSPNRTLPIRKNGCFERESDLNHIVPVRIGDRGGAKEARFDNVIIQGSCPPSVKHVKKKEAVQ